MKKENRHCVLEDEHHFRMHTPHSLCRMEEAVFNACANANWNAEAILSRSAKFGVPACIERNRGFVDHLIDECFWRALVELETHSVFWLLSVPSTIVE